MYEPSEDLNFMLTDTLGQPRDIFTFYGPFSAGYELATKRAALHNAPEITVWSVL